MLQGWPEGLCQGEVVRQPQPGTVPADWWPPEPRAVSDILGPPGFAALIT